jgi:hypothetical protein
MSDGADELWINAGSLRAPPPPPPENWEDVRPLLRSILRPATYGSLLRPGEPVAWRVPSTSFLHELVAIDQPTSRAIVTMTDTERWGIGVDELFAIARENVGALNPVSANVPGDHGAFVDADQNRYLTSALVTPGWLASFARPDGPRPIAFLPNEDTLIIGYDDLEEGPKFFEMAEEMYCASERHVSPEAFTVHGDQVVPFDKAGPHPLRKRALQLRACAAVRLYGEQQEFLKQVYEEELIDVFVAEIMTFDAGHGRRSAAVWGEGITIALPEVDYIAFVNQRERFVVPFPVVIDLVGIQQTEGFYPPRYLVNRWPEPELLAALRFHKVSSGPGS